MTLLTISPDAKRGFSEKVVDGGLRMVETPDMLWGMGRSGWDPWDTLNRMGYIDRGHWDVVHGFDSPQAVVLPSIFAQKARQVPMVLDWCDWWGRGGTNTGRADPVVRAAMGPLETFFEEAFRGFPDGTTALGQPLYDAALQHGVRRSEPSSSVRGVTWRASSRWMLPRLGGKSATPRTQSLWAIWACYVTKTCHFSWTSSKLCGADLRKTSSCC